MEEFTLQDIVAIMKRRKKYFFVSTLLVFACALIFIVKWSNYRSTATVQIEQSNIETGMSEAIVTLADQRINQIQQKVTSLESLAQIIDKFDLYSGMRDSTPIAHITAKMRDKIKVELISANISNPAAAQKQTAEQLSAIAFELSFSYSSPEKTQQVADELVTRFLDEDLKMRRTQTQETSAFLASQIKAMEASMAEQEKAIADFKAKNGDSGPSAQLFNQQSMASLNMNIQSIDTQMTANEGTQGALRAQLAVVDPYSRVVADGQLLTTPSTQLKAMETEYTALTSRYGPEHPDVVKVRRQIAALKAQVGPGTSSAQLKAQIADVRTNLAAAKQTNGADHPDVMALQEQLKMLEAKLAAAPKSSTADNGLKSDADNPAYLQLTAQLKAAEIQHKSLEAQKDALIAERAKYERTIALSPAVEQEMAKLTRDYENSQLRYRELKEKKMAADMNEQLESGRKGQRLVVINPPDLPADTHPKRLLLLIGGCAISLAASLGSMIALELIKQSVHGPNHLAYLVGATPLITIPYMRTEHEKNPARRVRYYLKTLAGFLQSLNAMVRRLISSKA